MLFNVDPSLRIEDESADVSSQKFFYIWRFFGDNALANLSVFILGNHVYLSFKLSSLFILGLF